MGEKSKPTPALHPADIALAAAEAAPTHARVKLEVLADIRALCHEVSRTDAGPVGVGELARSILAKLDG